MAATPGRQPNSALVAALRANSLTQDEIAARVNDQIALLFGNPGACSAPQVRRWTSGTAGWPHPQYLIALEVVLGKSPLELGFIPRTSNSLDHLARIRGTVLKDFAVPDGAPVDRRQFLGAVAGVALSQDAQSHRAGKIGALEVRDLRKRLEELHALDGRFGGGDLSTLARKGYESVDGALADCSYSASTSRSLYSVAGEFAASGGWFAFDSGNHTLAESQYNLALKLSMMADDHVLQAHVLIAMAVQALWKRNIRECASLAQAALDQKAARGNPRIAALFHARLALAHAHQGQGKSSAKCFSRAEHLLDKASGMNTENPPWLTFFDLGEIAGLRAQGALALGDYATAERVAAETSSAIGPQFTRNSFMHTLTQVQAQIGLREIDHACSTMAGALAVAPRVRSERARTTLSAIREKFTAYPSLEVEALFAKWHEGSVDVQWAT